ncbi:MAG: rhomboid family intramembrane serine protease [Eubacteriales bacterium]
MNRFERFLNRNNHKGIRNLMLYIVIGNVLVFLLSQTDRGITIVNYLTFIPQLILQGQVWRLITFVFIPPSFNLLTLLLSLYFYYMVGSVLEREWGVLRFNVYYISGIVLTIIYSLISNTYASAHYINLSLFFAFATLFPDFQILLFFFIPIKIKYLAYVNAAFFLMGIILNRFPANLLPLIAIANYFLYFYQDIIYFFKRQRMSTRNTVSFKSKVRNIKKERGYLHRCTTCGKTDTDYPDMEFRYCSLCRGYACYCEEHIMDHTHIQ